MLQPFTNENAGPAQVTITTWGIPKPVSLAPGYPRPMEQPTAASSRLRATLASNRSEVGALLRRYGADNLRMFGSAARGDARDDSDLDLFVDLAPGSGNELLRVSGLAEELSELLGVRVDVVAAPLLRDEVSATALADAVPV